MTDDPRDDPMRGTWFAVAWAIPFWLGLIALVVR